MLRSIANWPSYLKYKAGNAAERFKFVVRGLGEIAVERRALGPFRENFFDDLYFAGFPDEVLKRLKGNPLMLDVGANVGFFALAAFRKFPKATIYSFEPHPYCIGELNSYREQFDQFDWSIVAQAMSKEKATLQLTTDHPDDFTSTASLTPHERHHHSFDVQADTLAAFLERNQIAQIDYLKLDCEGAEYDILYNADPQTMQQIKAACIEAHPSTEPENSLGHLEAFLQKQGFKTATLDDNVATGMIYAWRED